MSLQISKIVLENVFGYEQLDIDFDTDQRTLIVGANNSGKSAFGDALCWILYGNWPRGEKLKNVIRNGQDKARGELHFADNNGETKIIIRERDINDVSTLTLEGFNVSDVQSGSRTKDKQKLIDASFGDQETYRRTAYMVRGFLSIADPQLRPAERRTLLRKFFGVELIELALKNARTEASLFNVEYQSKLSVVSTLKQQIKDIDAKVVEGLNVEIEQANSEYKELDALNAKAVKYQELVEAKSVQSNKNEMVRQKLEMLNPPDIDAGLKQVQRLFDTSIAELQRTLELEHGVFDRLKIEYRGIEATKQDDAYIADLEQKVGQAEVFLNENKMAHKELQAKQNRVLLIERKITELGDKGIICPNCNTPLVMETEGIMSLEAYTKILTDEKTSIESDIQKLLEIVDKLKIHDAEFASGKEKLALQDKVVKQLEDLSNKGSAIKAKLVLLKQQFEDKKVENIKAIQQRQKELDIELEMYETKSKAFRSDLDLGIEAIQDIQSKIEALYDPRYVDVNGKLKQKSEQIFQLKLKLEHYNADIATNEKLKLSIEKEQVTISNLQQMLVILNFWVSALPKVEQFLLQDSVNQLESESNRWLSLLSNQNVNFSLDKNGVYCSIKDDKNEEWQLSQLGSGIGSRIALATTFALSGILKSKFTAPSWVFIDEATDNLDDEGVEAFMYLLEQIDGQRFVITHNTLLKQGGFDVVYEVSKIGEKSIIEEKK